MTSVTALHFTDPGCPWAYSARPRTPGSVWRFAEQIEWRLVAIGLSETTERCARPRPDAGEPGGGLAHVRAALRDAVHAGAEAAPCRHLAGVSRDRRAPGEVDPGLGERAFRELQLLQFASTPGLLDDDSDLREDARARVPGLDAEAIVAGDRRPREVPGSSTRRTRAHALGRGLATEA